MAKKRKTIEVEWLRRKVNAMLGRNDITDQFRLGMCQVLEDVLTETNNYRGYGYQDWMNGGYNTWVLDGRPDYPCKKHYIGNDTKRFYH